MKKFVSIWVLILVCSACSTSQKSSQTVIDKNFPIRPLVETGRSQQVSLHPSGDRFLFVSSERFEHSHPQVYEYLFSQKQERRVTFQDGQTAHPQYLGTRQIAYQSTTDQIKESLFRQPASLETMDMSQAFEIYQSDLFGNSIERLTFNKGFDGQLRSFSKGNSRGLSYISETRSQRKVVLYNDSKTWSPQLKASVSEAQVVGLTQKVITIEQKKEDQKALVVRSLKDLSVISEWPIERFQSFSLSADESKIFLIQSEDKDSVKSSVVVYDLERLCEVKWFDAPIRLEQIVEIPGQMNQFLMVYQSGNSSKIGTKELTPATCEKIVSK